MIAAKKRDTVSIVITLTTFAFALYTQVIWAIVTSNTTVANKDGVQSFLTYFPPFFRNIAIITYLTLACSILTIIFSSGWIKRERGFIKATVIIILILAILITLLTLFQLM
ncbi:MAG: hypothetical protein M3040_05890 [Bacteroidota bacterium]|nr:hypothetical protein [Bacteroidota bacterium]